MAHEAGDCELLDRQREADAGAHPPTGAERDELVVGPSEIHRGATAHEPLRAELLRRVPRRRVLPDRSHVDVETGLGGDLVSLHDRRCCRFVRYEERQRRVEPEHLFEHCF